QRDVLGREIRPAVERPRMTAAELMPDRQRGAPGPEGRCGERGADRRDSGHYEQQSGLHDRTPFVGWSCPLARTVPSPFASGIGAVTDLGYGVRPPRLAGFNGCPTRRRARR